MNETTPTPERRPRHLALPTFEELGLHSSNEGIREQWREGLVRSGTAFAVYTQLDTPKLHTVDVLDEFRSMHLASYPSWEAAARQEVVNLGWESELRRFRDHHGISEDVLHWDFDELRHLMNEVYDGVEAGDGVHLFVR